MTQLPGLAMPAALLKSLVILLIAVAASVANGAESVSPQKAYLNSNPNFSQVVTVTHAGMSTIYVSGQVAISEGQIPSSFAEQIDLVFANLSAQLLAAGAGLSDVVKLTGFIVDIDGDRVAAYSQARNRYFASDSPAPASTLVGVAGLVRESFLVEVEATAVIAAP